MVWQKRHCIFNLQKNNTFHFNLRLNSQAVMIKMALNNMAVIILVKCHGVIFLSPSTNFLLLLMLQICEAFSVTQ